MQWKSNRKKNRLKIMSICLVLNSNLFLFTVRSVFGTIVIYLGLFSVFHFAFVVTYASRSTLNNQQNHPFSNCKTKSIQCSRWQFLSQHQMQRQRSNRTKMKKLLTRVSSAKFKENSFLVWIFPFLLCDKFEKIWIK